MSWEIGDLQKRYTLVPKDRTFDDAIALLADNRISQANSQNQYWENGDCDTFPPYRQALNEIDAAIGKLKAARREMQAIASHMHEWNDDDYCRICGADGRA